MQMPVKICLIACAERGLRQFFFSNFPFSRRAIWHIFNQSSGIRSNKELYRVFLCVYVSHIWKFCRVAGWIFLIREKALRLVYLGETFRGTRQQRCNSSLFSRFVCHITVYFVWRRIIHRHEIFCESHCVAQSPTDCCQILSL